MARILVVENNPDQRNDLEWAVQGPDREVFTAENAQDALRKIAEQSFDVIVTDLKMETEQSGLEVLKAAKEKDVRTQVIMVTAYGNKAISVETMRMGAFDYQERNAPGTDFLEMVRAKTDLALKFRTALLSKEGEYEQKWAAADHQQ